MVEKVMHEQRSLVRRNWSQSDPSTEIRAWIDQRITVAHPCLPTMIFDKAQPDAIIEEWVEGEDLVSFLNQSAPLDDLQVAGIILQLLDVVSHTSGAAGKDFCPTAEDVVIRQLERTGIITWTGWRPISKQPKTPSTTYQSFGVSPIVPSLPNSIRSKVILKTV